MHTWTGGRGCLIGSAALAALALSACAASRETQVPTPPAIPELSERLQRYVELRRTVAGSLPKLPDKASPAELKSHQADLCAKLKTARAGARPGDIFTPAVAERFRRLIGSELTGSSTDARNSRGTVLDEAPTAPIAVQVNAEYPSKTPVATTPPDVLLRLPILPDELEYRFVGPDLVLLDSEANLIVDFVRNAAPLPRG
jgi:hypothetical protein